MAYKFMKGVTTLSGSAMFDGKLVAQKVDGNWPAMAASSISGTGTLILGKGEDADFGGDAIVAGTALMVNHADGILIQQSTNTCVKLFDDSDYGAITLNKHDHSASPRVDFSKGPGTGIKLSLENAAEQVKFTADGASGVVTANSLKLHTGTHTVGGLTVAGGLTVNGATVALQGSQEVTANGLTIKMKKDAAAGVNNSVSTGLLIGNGAAGAGMNITYLSGATEQKYLAFTNGDGTAAVNARALSWKGDGSALSGTPSSAGEYTYTINELVTGDLACVAGINYATASCTATLPAAPTAGDRVRVKAFFVATDSSPLTITKNGSTSHTIAGSGGDTILLESTMAAVELTYKGSDVWLIS